MSDVPEGAALLREAAQDMRHDWSYGAEHGARHATFMVAVAEWLDASAAISTWSHHIGCGPVADTVDAATAVARAHFGASA